MIPQADPRANYLSHKAEIDSVIMETLESGRYILGEHVSEFEKKFAEYVGVDHAIGVGSGTDALFLALNACGVGDKDAVITVSHTAVATIAAIEMTGATPILVDIDPVYYTMRPESLEKTVHEALDGKICAKGITPKAVIPVHMYGFPADMPSIVEIARSNGLFIVEDCAHAHGASIDKRKTGAWGDLSAFSFYPTKNLGALGDGGIVVTDNGQLAEKVRSLREYGWRKRFISEIPGINSRLDEIQASILRVKLRHLDRDNKKRDRIAATYDSFFRNSKITIPQSKAGYSHVYHQYVIATDHRDELRSHLGHAGVETAIHYPLPVHLQPAYKDRIPTCGSLPVTTHISKKILSLPMYPELDAASMTEILRAFSSWEGLTK